MGVLSDRVNAENRKFAEEVEREMEEAEATPEVRTKEAPKRAKRSEPKVSEPSVKKYRPSEDIRMLRMSEEWDHLCRISEAFGVIMENPNVARRLSNSVFSDMVQCQIEFFKVLMDKQFSED